MRWVFSRKKFSTKTFSTRKLATMPLAFVLKVGCFGRGRRLAVIEGNPMRYGRGSRKCILVARREIVWCCCNWGGMGEDGLGRDSERK